MSGNNPSTPHIVMYESNWCGFCRAAKRLIESKGWQYESRSVDGNAELRASMTSITGRTSVPQIFFGDTHVGGFDDLEELEQRGELEALYAQCEANHPDNSAS